MGLYDRASRCIHGEELWEQVGLGKVVRATGLYMCRPDPDDMHVIPYWQVPEACRGCTRYRIRGGQTTLDGWA